MRSAEAWRAVIVARAGDTRANLMHSRLAAFLLNDLIGYPRNSPHRQDDVENVASLLTALTNLMSGRFISVPLSHEVYKNGVGRQHDWVVRDATGRLLGKGVQHINKATAERACLAFQHNVLLGLVAEDPEDPNAT